MRIKSFFNTSFAFLYGFLLPTTSWAQTSTEGNGVLPKQSCINDGSCGLQDIPFFIYYFVNFLIGIAGTLAVLMLMYGGYQYIVGGIVEDQKAKAKKTITYAVAGLIVSSLAWVIINVLQTTLAG